MATFSIEISKESKSKLNSLFMSIAGNADKALARSINKTLKGVRTDITNEIKSKINLQKSFIQKTTGKKSQRTFSLHYASSARPTGTISTRGANIPLIYYSNVRGKTKRALAAKTIKIQIKKSQPKIKLKHGFVPKLRSGHRGIFAKRFSEDKKSRKIKELYGPKIPGHLLRPEIYNEVQKKANIRIDKNISHEVDYMLGSL